MTIEEIKKAIENNQKVYWSHRGYEVIRDNFGEYFIKCLENNRCIRLTDISGQCLNGDESDFFTDNPKISPNTNYQRVLPRDLFNEAKLLKCLGRLFLMQANNQLNPNIRLEHDTSLNAGFTINQDQSDGSFFVSNISVYVNDVLFYHCANLNCKDAYPLILTCSKTDEEFYVFDDNGNLASEFSQNKD